ncbi:MAG TPA: hypothetical protein VFS21_34625 [Roseiflexaceae bacterium]|nr:hypothetical protein [Roseiflexaceae bacterium]
MPIDNIDRPIEKDPEDLIKILGERGTMLLLEIMRDAYFDLLKDNEKYEEMDEDQITENWFVRISQRWRQSSSIPFSIIPIHQKPDKSKAKRRGKSPVIDFCFRGDWDKRVYFGTECKLVEADNKTLCNKYVNNGLMRYFDGKYNPICQEAAMVGYIRKTSFQNVAIEINARLRSKDSSWSLNKKEALMPFEGYYISTHTRTDKPSFLIHHLFLTFTKIEP